jgi:uncharacterized protein (TIGR02594 family)
MAPASKDNEGKQDLDLRRLEFDERTKERELSLREKEFGRATWNQPLTLAILAAVLTAGGNIVSSNISTYNQIAVEKEKADNQLLADRQKSREQFFLDILRTGNNETSSSNLQFFLDIGVLTEKDFPGLQKALTEVAEGKRAAPVLPSNDSAKSQPPCNLGLGASKEQIDKFLEASVIAGTDKWVKIAVAEIGVCETPGDDSNPAIVEYIKTTDENWPTARDDTPWVAAFANWVMIKAGYQGTRSLTSVSFRNWGKEIETPVVGSIVVLSPRAGTSSSGTVGFYMGEYDERQIWVLQGNVGNAVQVVAQHKSRVTGYRMPIELGSPQLRP